jgi:SAM-dependent methyltransferase
VTETLPLTGERTAPGIWHENYWFARHEAAYRWVAGLGAGRNGRVLDAGCGEGYGADLLRRELAATVHAVDYDLPTLTHVRRSYPQIPCLQGNLVRQALADSSYDLVVSMQTVEHLWDQPAFVAECARVVRPGATVVITTPNRLTFPPGNCYHTKELTAAELVELVAAELRIEQVAGVWHGSRLSAWEKSHGSCVTAQLAGEPATWPDDLAELVRGTSYGDFVIGSDADLDTSLDLAVVATRR